MAKKRVKAEAKPIPSSLVSNEEKVSLLAQYLADPRELRTDFELARDLEIPLQELKKIKANPVFIEPVNQAFRRNLQLVGPDVIRQLFRQASEGSVQSQKLLLEAGNWIQSGKGTTINVGGVSVQKDDVAKLSDVDLDREIHRLLMETYPEDCIYTEGRVIPLDESDLEIEDVQYSDVGGNNGAGQEGEVVQASIGEAEEDGKV